MTETMAVATYGYLCVLFVLIDVFGVQCYPWDQRRLPVCTAHNQLCDVTFEIHEENPMTGPMTFPSGYPICQCPGGKACSNQVEDKTRVIYQELTSPGKSIKTKLSYCDAESLPSRVCDDNEAAVTLRGIGPIITEIVGGIKCKCPKALVLSKAEPDGIFSLRTYSCGMILTLNLRIATKCGFATSADADQTARNSPFDQKQCRVNSSTPPVCERVTDSEYGDSKVSHVQCQCPRGWECYIDPAAFSRPQQGSMEFTCRDRFRY